MAETSKPKFQRIPVPDGVATCLAAVILAGVHLAPGDPVSAELRAKVPEKNWTALLSTGIITLDPDEVTEGEAALHAQRRAALDEADATRKLLVQIQTDKSAAEQEVTDLEKKHRASALSDYRKGKA